MRIAGTDGARPGLYQYALRCGSLLVFLFAAPPLLSLLLTGLSSVGLLPDLARVLLSLCTFLGWFSYLLWTALLAVRHRPLFYERLSRTRNVSTVPFADEET